MYAERFSFYAVLLDFYDPSIDGVLTRPVALLQSEAEAWLVYHNVLAHVGVTEKNLMGFSFCETGWVPIKSDGLQAGVKPVQALTTWPFSFARAIADATLWLSTVSVLGCHCGVEKWAFDAGFVSKAICPPLRAVVRTPALSAFTASAGCAGEQRDERPLSGAAPDTENSASNA